MMRAEGLESTRRPKNEAEIFINKLEAARRQLDAAIRMTFSDEDELAIYTVAAAAYRILHDILAKRGQDDFENAVRGGVLALARSFLKGELSADELRHAGTWECVSEIAGLIRGHEDDPRLCDLSEPPPYVKHLPFELSSEIKSAYWHSMVNSANFLKHADRDADSALALSQLDNETLLWQASKAYVMLMGMPTPEMVVFAIHWSVARYGTEGIHSDAAGVAERLSRLTPTRRRRACNQMIRQWKGGHMPF